MNMSMVTDPEAFENAPLILPIRITVSVNTNQQNTQYLNDFDYLSPVQSIILV